MQHYVQRSMSGAVPFRLRIYHHAPRGRLATVGGLAESRKATILCFNLPLLYVPSEVRKSTMLPTR